MLLQSYRRGSDAPELQKTAATVRSRACFLNKIVRLQFIVISNECNLLNLLPLTGGGVTLNSSKKHLGCIIMRLLFKSEHHVYYCTNMNMKNIT